MTVAAVDRRRLKSRAEIAGVADLLRRLAGLAGEGGARVLELAAALERAADAEQPGATLAREFGMPRYRRAPAKIERDHAYAAQAACGRYAGLVGKPRFVKVVEDLRRYAASAAWRADRKLDACPYMPSDWHYGAWHALMVSPGLPYWKTVKRAVAKRGQNSFGHGACAESPATTSPEHSAE